MVCKLASSKRYSGRCVLRIIFFESSNRFAPTPTSGRKKREEEEGGRKGKERKGESKSEELLFQKKLSGTSEEEKGERCQNLSV